jgi:hypothetical protein
VITDIYRGFRKFLQSYCRIVNLLKPGIKTDIAKFKEMV